jgi:hypothetical protein
MLLNIVNKTRDTLRTFKNEHGMTIGDLGGADNPIKTVAVSLSSGLGYPMPVRYGLGMGTSAIINGERMYIIALDDLELWVNGLERFEMQSGDVIVLSNAARDHIYVVPHPESTLQPKYLTLY